MKCFFGGSGMRREYELEEKAMLQRLLLQEQREVLSLREELQGERMKNAMLEQEVAQLVEAAQEMGESMSQFFSKGPEADTRTSQDQSISSRPAQASMAMQLQCIPEHMQKQHELLEFAEQVKGFAAQLQDRLARASTANTPTAAEAAAAAAASPFSMHGAPQPQQSGTPVRVPSRSHSMSVPSEQPGSMDLPMQALAVSRLALQLHRPSGPGEDTSCVSSSGRSCTMLGGSVDLTHSINSFPSIQHSHQSAATGLGMLDCREQQQLSRAAARCSVTRGAAAIAGRCASIAAAAAATAAAAAARKAATAAAMADKNQAGIDLRASTCSGFSSLTSPGKSHDMSSMSAGLEQRHRWQQAQQQQHAQHAQQQQWDQHQQLTSNPLWAPTDDDVTGSDSSGSRPNSAEACLQTEPCLQAFGTPALQAYDGSSISSSESASAEPSPTAAGAPQHDADKLSKLPAVPPHLVLPQRHMQEPPAALQSKQQQLEQHMRLPPQQQQQHQALRYNLDELSELTSPQQTGSSGSTSATAGPMTGANQRPCHFASVNSRPPMYMQPTPSLTPARNAAQLGRTAAQPSEVGPLHRNLASLSSSFGSNRSSTTPGFMSGRTY